MSENKVQTLVSARCGFLRWATFLKKPKILNSFFFFSSLLVLLPLYSPGHRQLYSSSLRTVSVPAHLDAWLAFCYRWWSPVHTQTRHTHFPLNRCWTTLLMGSQWGGTMLANNNALFPFNAWVCARTHTHARTLTHAFAGWQALVLPRDRCSFVCRSCPCFFFIEQIGVYVN